MIVTFARVLTYQVTYFSSGKHKNNLHKRKQSTGSTAKYWFNNGAATVKRLVYHNRGRMEGTGIYAGRRNTKW